MLSRGIYALPDTIPGMVKKGSRRDAPLLDPEFPSRLLRELKRTKLKKTELARRAKLTRQAIYRLTNVEEPPKNIEPLTLFAICGVTDTNPRWLVTGEGPRILIQVGDKALAIAPMAAQLLYFYQHMEPDDQDALVGAANRYYVKAHPEKSGANPYGDVEKNMEQIERLEGMTPTTR